MLRGLDLSHHRFGLDAATAHLAFELGEIASLFDPATLHIDDTYVQSQMDGQLQVAHFFAAEGRASCTRDPLRHRRVEIPTSIDLAYCACGELGHGHQGFTNRLRQGTQHGGDQLFEPARHEPGELSCVERAQQRLGHRDRDAIVGCGWIEAILQRKRITAHAQLIRMTLRRDFRNLAIHQIFERHQKTRLM